MLRWHPHPRPAPVPSYHWCPGDQWDPGWGNNPDWNHCHDWQGSGGLSQGGPVGWGPWGPPPRWAPPPPPPSWAPGANVMWSPTISQWGFWNNGVRTPI
ncbi:MAG TPA: hypothetical protein VNY55_03530 [Mycobacterium sp.]|nr:hypothetical protein [Mycobacterium sp.]